MLMRRAGLQGITGRPWFRRVPNVPTATDLVERQFDRDEPDRLWVTEHPTREGKVCCAVVLDVYSRRVVGWSIDSAPTAALVTSALGMAIDHRRPDGSTVIHSDQGTQGEFTSWAFTRRAIDSGPLPSVGSVGDCFDAVIESFWRRMQVELLDRKRWRTRVGLASAIFEYLEIFHNRQRRHSSLGMLTPVEFETRQGPKRRQPEVQQADSNRTRGTAEPPGNPGRVTSA
jgi:transposase InsO family protein